MTPRRFGLALGILTLAAAAVAYAQMPNPKEMSGIPRPDPSLAAGTLSVRVIRGDFANNVADQPVEFVVGGKPRTVRTDAEGRAEISGLAPGTDVRASTTLDGVRLDSQPITMPASGVRMMLVGDDPNASKRAAEDARLASLPPVKGTMAMGPESRVVVQFQEERLDIFYTMEFVNSARTRVDIGGPLIIDLPAEARGASLMDGSSKQASVTAGRVTITGPFAPGSTSVQVAFEMPFDGPTVRLSQRWPAVLPQPTVLMPLVAGLDLKSPQFSDKRTVIDQGQQVVVGTGAALAAGQALELEVTGLPFHAHWPRYVALALAGAIMTVGLWAAFFVPVRRRTA